MTDTDHSDILRNIARCDDPARLRVWMKNARARDAEDVYDAAFRQLIAIQPSAEVGTVAYDVWRSIHALEELLREERGKTVRLSKTRHGLQESSRPLGLTPSQRFRPLGQ